LYAPKGDKLKRSEIRAWGIYLQDRYMDQSTGFQGKELKIIAGVNKVVDI
jgi:hypothetical protein